MKRLAIIALSLATAMSSVPPPAGAFPTMPTVKSETADVQRVQFSYERGEQFKGSGCRYPCFRGRDYRRGHYSNRYYRNGYRRHHYRHYDDDDDDIGALFGGLAAGAIIGGLLAQQGTIRHRDIMPEVTPMSAGAMGAIGPIGPTTTLISPIMGRVDCAFRLTYKQAISESSS